MFDEQHALLEVVKAIEELRGKQGTTNRQICDFVRKRARNPNDPMKVLKTVRTLNKLVDEGVVIKRGRRYLFPNKKRNLKSEEVDCEEEKDAPAHKEKSQKRNIKKYNNNNKTERDIEKEMKDLDLDLDADDEWTFSDDDGEEDEKKKGGTSTSNSNKRVSRGNRKGSKRQRRRKTSESSIMKELKEELINRSRSPRKRKNSDNDPCDSEAIRSMDSEEKSRRNGNPGIDQEGEIEIERDGEFSQFRYRSPLGPPPPNTPGVHVNRKESCCSDLGAEDVEAIKRESEFEDEVVVNVKHDRANSKRATSRASSKVRERQSRRREKDEEVEKGRKEKSNRNSFLEDDLKREKRSVSLCSHCERNKIEDDTHLT